MNRDRARSAWYYGWVVTRKGSSMSGNWGHKGRPGMRGGSLSGAGHRSLGRFPPGRSDAEKRQIIKDRIERTRQRRREEQEEKAAVKQEQERAAKKAAMAERWRGRVQADVEGQARRADFSDFTPEVREVVTQSLTEIAYKGLQTGNEHLIALNMDGNKVNGTIEGGKDYVQGQGLMLQHPAILIHNHPSSNSFSDADIAQLFYDSDMQHLFVTGADGTLYRMSKTEFTMPSLVPQTIMEDWARFKEDLMDDFLPKVQSGEISRRAAWKEQTHQISERMARTWGLDYERVLPSGGES